MKNICVHQHYFQIFCNAGNQLSDYPRGTACYARALFAWRWMNWHGRKTSLIWAIGEDNNFIAPIEQIDWGKGMVWHVALLEEETQIVHDTALFSGPVTQCFWQNSFIPHPSGRAPICMVTPPNYYVRKNSFGNPELAPTNLHSALNLAHRSHNRTLDLHAPKNYAKIKSDLVPRI